MSWEKRKFDLGDIVELMSFDSLPSLRKRQFGEVVEYRCGIEPENTDDSSYVIKILFPEEGDEAFRTQLFVAPRGDNLKKATSEEAAEYHRLLNMKSKLPDTPNTSRAFDSLSNKDYILEQGKDGLLPEIDKWQRHKADATERLAALNKKFEAIILSEFTDGNLAIKIPDVAGSPFLNSVGPVLKLYKELHLLFGESVLEEEG